MRGVVVFILIIFLMMTLPFSIDVKADNEGPIFSNERPGRNSITTSLSPVLVVNYSDPDGMDLSSVRIRIDGRDVTEWEVTHVREDGVEHQVPSILPLAPGNHTIVVIASDLIGNEANYSWTFRVDPNYLEGGMAGQVDIASLIGGALAIIAVIGLGLLLYIIYLKLIRRYTWRKYFAQHPVHKHYLTFYGPIAGAVIFMLIAFMYIADGSFSSPWAYEYAFIVAFIIGILPFAVSARLERRMIARYEYAFSQFLFELADAIRGGMDPAKAIVEFSKVDTGVMRKQLAIAADGIRLGRPFEDMMLVMTKKMNSELISRYSSLIGEAAKLGGDISVVIHRAAKDMDDMIRIENERRRQISMQATTIYISFSVLIIVIYLLIDIYPSIGSLDMGLFGGGGLESAMSDVQPRMSFEMVKRRFFHLVLIISISSGVLIGLFSEGRLKYGLLHAILMVAASTVFFALMVF